MARAGHPPLQAAPTLRPSHFTPLLYAWVQICFIGPTSGIEIDLQGIQVQAVMGEGRGAAAWVT